MNKKIEKERLEGWEKEHKIIKEDILLKEYKKYE